MTEHSGDPAHQGAHVLMEAEQLLEQAERDPAAARLAAASALRALLRYWNQTPRGDRIGELLAQVAETDDTLAQFMADAAALDGDADADPADRYARAKVFVDAARGRVVNI